MIRSRAHSMGQALGLTLAMGLCVCTASARDVRTDHQEFAARFARLLIEDSDSLDALLDPEEAALSMRWGIQYENIARKYIIGFDFDAGTRQLLRSGVVRCQPVVESLPDGYRVVKIRVPDRNVSRSFYFNPKGQWISPVRYFARQWVRKESPHFSFWISDSSLLPPEAMEQLEGFLRQAAALLHYSDDDMRTLENNKIIYVLCRTEAEIEQLTGFRSRGMYMLAFDYVTTTYHCHFHELMHALVNFKLRRLPLYTHPLLQEGFAVAIGGRGGIAPRSLLQSGAFLAGIGAMNYTDLLSTRAFHEVDPSLSYPVSGAYVSFLLDALGTEGFLHLYRKYSGDSDQVEKMSIPPEDLPADAAWLAFAGKMPDKNPILLSLKAADRTCIFADPALEVWAADSCYHVFMRDMAGLKQAEAKGGYASNRFAEVCRGRVYQGERYLFVADTNEVTIYDLFTDNSIAGYSSSFSLKGEKVRQVNGRLTFWVRQDIFTEPLNTMHVVRYER